MIRIIRFLFTGDWHLHHWVIIDKVDWMQRDSNWRGYSCRCDGCGEIKHFHGK